MYNLLSCKGFGEQAVGYIGAAGCIKARLGLVILFFLIAIIRKWGGEEVGLEFNFWTSLILGITSYFLVITIFGSMKFALIIGIGLALLGGYGAGYFFGSGDSGE